MLHHTQRLCARAVFTKFVRDISVRFGKTRSKLPRTRCHPELASLSIGSMKMCFTDSGYWSFHVACHKKMRGEMTYKRSRWNIVAAA